ncbi:triose-phosphate isomerase [Jeongeupia chitinilytica]|uniref:Triosephosphate isomerase n=1 Tax=Jeongeupia chitinilytica TaxID=1041641 RepID=A0ABQ3GZ27_9NEIS|nr:triose-phosphate isomerase [Jeongeupia chitinilytica]GHD62160.1 triosephosphate isomerase [Jeongeupia chitinilytica]
MKTVIGNWKMNGNIDLLHEVVPTLVQEGLGSTVGLCLPYPYLGAAHLLLREAQSGIKLGAQNVSEHPSGGHTGEISAGMLKEFGCRLVLIGHPERRSMYGETREVTARKLHAALDAGLYPVYCVGETLAQRESGKAHQQMVDELSLLAGVPTDRFAIAYEPSWAIGGGVTATAADISEMHGFIKDVLGAGTRVLYGGSVKAHNAAQVLCLGSVDGVLVGNAALSASEFLSICRIADRSPHGEPIRLKGRAVPDDTVLRMPVVASLAASAWHEY